MVDLYWKCYAYGDELKPHIEFLDGIMLSSTRGIVKDLIEKGKVILQNPDKPKFLESHVQRIEIGWDDTKAKAQSRLQLLTETKDAWVGYAENSETIVVEYDKAEEEIKKVKKRFQLDAANEDLKKRRGIFKHTKDTIDGLESALNANFACMCITVPDDKKKLVDKELKTLFERLTVVGTFNEKVSKVEEFVNALTEFDVSLKGIDSWMSKATEELNDIKNCSASMAPEDRVARTMDLQEDIAAKVEIIKADTAKELELLPQGENVPRDAQDFKDELKRITDYVLDLQKKVAIECDKYSEDVKFWAEYKTGIKEFSPWLAASESASGEGLSKPTNLDEAKAAAQKMTSHETADTEVAALRERYTKVKAVSDEWVAKDKTSEGENQFSLEKMESTLGELKNIFKEKE